MLRKIKIYFYSLIVKFILNSILLTCRVKGKNDSLFLSCINKHPVLLSVWHHQSLLLAQYIRKNNIPVWAISSTHTDSEILANILISWKIKLIRGSSTRGWVNIIKQMVALYKSSPAIIAVTPDGPRGPRKLAKPGAFSVAKKYNAQIFSVSARASSFWSLPSWDKTIIPKPFSTIYIQCTLLPSNIKLDSGLLSKQINLNQKNFIENI